MTADQVIMDQQDAQAPAMEIATALQPLPEEPGEVHLAAHEMVGRRFLTPEGQEVIVTFVESIPKYSDEGRLLGYTPHIDIVEDFTRLCDGPSPIRPAAMSPDRLEMTERNIRCNAGLVGKGLEGLPPRETVYVVGSGPSLMQNRHALERIDKDAAAVVGCNELLQYLPAGILDYYAAIDAGCPSKWHSGIDVSRTTALICTMAPSHFTLSPWRDLRWFKLRGQGGHVNLMEQCNPGLSELSLSGYAVSLSMIEFAYRFLKARTIVLAGFDFAYKYIDGIVYDHIDEPLSEDYWEGIYRMRGRIFARDIFGRPAVSDYNLLRAGMAVMGAIRCLADAGVRVINATEGGVLVPNEKCPAVIAGARHEVMPLEAVVETLNV